MKRITLIIVMMLLGLTSSAQKQSENGFTDIITPDTTLNKFMMYWLRKPYKLGGNTEKGIDCSQFNKRLYMDVYGLNLENICYKQWNQTIRLKQDSLITGDLVFFRSKLSPSGWHCGVFIGHTYFIHAANRYEGVKISSLNEPRYMNSIRGFGRLKQVK
jgi:cell wall-associated NlpC family hydrolase